MKRYSTVCAIVALSLSAGLANARDLGPDEALRLRDAGTVKNFEQLNATALEQHPGATITETELEEEYGRYIYQLDIRDKQGIKWDIEMDAASGKILKNQQDD